jgi:nitrate reductase delta subunit
MAAILLVLLTARVEERCMMTTSMEEYGVINLERLYDFKNAFGFFAQQLNYPDKLDDHPLVIDEFFDSSDPAYEYVKKYGDLIQDYSLEQRKEMYVQTFDFQNKTTLYMTYYKFEDSRERGQILVFFKGLYELFGLRMLNEELSDYLPLMCEFLYAAEWQDNAGTVENMRILLAAMEDGTYHLTKALEKSQSLYYDVVKGLRETLKVCIQQEASSHEHT